MFERLKAFAELPVGWDTYGAEPPNATAIINAVAVICHLRERNWRPDRLAASAEGGVAIAFYQGTRYGDIECYNTGEMLACVSDGTGEPEVWDLGTAQLERAIERIHAYVYK